MRIRNLFALLFLLLSAAAFPQACILVNGACVSQGGSVVIIGSGGAPSVPTAVQIIMQGQTTPNSAAFYNSGWGGAPSTISGLSPNLQEIGWQAVSGATSYNIYDNGTMIANVSDSTASTNYTSYASGQTGQNCQDGQACEVAPGINRAYSDTSATSVVGNFLVSPGFVNVINATGSISSGNQLITISALATNTIIAGQNINASAGVPNNDSIATLGSACTGGTSSGSGSTGTYCLTSPATATETGETAYIASNGSFIVTINTTNGNELFTIASITPQTIAAGQTFGGPGLPTGTTVSAFSSSCTGGTSSGSGGTGTYCLSNAATNNETNQTYGTVYLGGQTHLMQVQAVNGSGSSSLSSYAIIPFITNGELLMSGGVFTGGSLTKDQVAPATTPLGYSDAAEWNTGTSNIINTYTGNSAASYNLGTAGYNYIYFNAYTTQSGVTLNYEPEIAGDGQLEAVTTFSAQGYTPQPLTQNAWSQVKIPLCGSNGANLDSTTGFLGKTNVCQTSFYKITWAGTVTLTAPIYVEIYFSVN